MKTKWMAAAAVLGFIAAPAHAVPVTNGGFTYEFLDFSGASAITPDSCGTVGQDYRCNEMKFNGGVGGDLAVTATSGDAGALVYQNLPQWNGGLGVVAVGNPNQGKAVGAGEVLKLSFENAVNLVGYHVYQAGGAPGADHFQVKVDGGDWQTRSFASVVFNQGHSDRWLTGKEFWFRAEDRERFYLGAAKIMTAVPEPASYALMLAGLAAVGFAARRRRQG